MTEEIGLVNSEKGDFLRKQTKNQAKATESQNKNHIKPQKRMLILVDIRTGKAYNFDIYENMAEFTP